MSEDAFRCVHIGSCLGQRYLRKQYALGLAFLLCRDAQPPSIGKAHRDFFLGLRAPGLPSVCLAFLEGGKLHLARHFLQPDIACGQLLPVMWDKQVFPSHFRSVEMEHGLHGSTGICRLQHFIRHPQVQGAEAGVDGMFSA